jgi:hypothetical protein
MTTQAFTPEQMQLVDQVIEARVDHALRAHVKMGRSIHISALVPTDFMVEPNIVNGNLVPILTRSLIEGAQSMVVFARNRAGKPVNGVVEEGTPSGMLNITPGFEFFIYEEMPGNVTGIRPQLLAPEILAELDRQTRLLDVKEMAYFYLSILVRAGEPANPAPVVAPTPAPVQVPGMPTVEQK